MAKKNSVKVHNKNAVPLVSEQWLRPFPDLFVDVAGLYLRGKSKCICSDHNSGATTGEMRVESKRAITCRLEGQTQIQILISRSRATLRLMAPKKSFANIFFKLGSKLMTKSRYCSLRESFFASSFLTRQVQFTIPCAQGVVDLGKQELSSPLWLGAGLPTRPRLRCRSPRTGVLPEAWRRTCST